MRDFLAISGRTMGRALRIALLPALLILDVLLLPTWIGRSYYLM